MNVCKHCKLTFDISNKPKGWMANHSRWCNDNPKRQTYSNDMAKARAGITQESNRKQGIGVSAAWSRGSYSHVAFDSFSGRNHTEETKRKISIGALASKHRRLKKNMIEYNGIMLDSSWEFELAKRLDELNISWSRPDPLSWIDADGISHNYFPDFYLKDYDLYLDPKNPHAIAVQKDKLTLLQQQYNNIVIIDTLEGCKTFSI